MDKRVFFKLPKTGLKGEANTRHFKWAIDEPADVGGNDTAPTPTELLYGSLAGCVAITIRLYAERKGWDTGEINVDVYTVNNGTKDLEIHKKIEFGNKDLTEEQLKRLYIIAEKCPVSKLLSEQNNIITDK